MLAGIATNTVIHGRGEGEENKKGEEKYSHAHAHTSTHTDAHRYHADMSRIRKDRSHKWGSKSFNGVHKSCNTFNRSMSVRNFNALMTLHWWRGEVQSSSTLWALNEVSFSRWIVSFSSFWFCKYQKYSKRYNERQLKDKKAKYLVVFFPLYYATCQRTCRRTV